MVQSTREVQTDSEGNKLQYPYSMRFQDTSAQCYLLDAQKIEADYRKVYRKQFEAEVVEHLTTILTARLTVELQKEFADKFEEWKKQFEAANMEQWEQKLQLQLKEKLEAHAKELQEVTPKAGVQGQQEYQFIT